MAQVKRYQNFPIHTKSRRIPEGIILPLANNTESVSNSQIVFENSRKLIQLFNLISVKVQSFLKGLFQYKLRTN